jgi:hypothetical protein
MAEVNEEIPTVFQNVTPCMLGNMNRRKILRVENDGAYTALTMLVQYLTKLFTVPFPNTH